MSDCQVAVHCFKHRASAMVLDDGAGIAIESCAFSVPIWASSLLPLMFPRGLTLQAPFGDRECPVSDVRASYDMQSLARNTAITRHAFNLLGESPLECRLHPVIGCNLGPLLHPVTL